MKAFTLIVVILAFAAVNATSIKSSLTKIDSHSHGRALLNLISMNMQIKTPFSAIQTLLDNISDDLHQDFDFQGAIYHGNVDRYTEAIASGEALEQTLITTIGTLNNQISNYKTNIATTTEILTNNQNELAAKEQRLADINVAYPVDIQNFDNELVAIDEALNAIDEAVGLVNELITRQNQEKGTALIQMSSKARAGLTSLAQKLQNTAALKKNGMTPLIKELVQLAATAQAKDAARILGLIQNLREILSTADADLEVVKQTYIDSYNAEKATLEERIGNLESSITSDQIAIATWNTELADTEFILGTTEAGLAETQEQLQADRDSLQNTEERWVRYSTEQKEILDLVEILINHFNNNVQQVDEFVRERVDIETVA